MIVGKYFFTRIFRMSMHNYEIVIFVCVAHFANFKTFSEVRFQVMEVVTTNAVMITFFRSLQLLLRLFYLQMLITMMMRRRRRRRNFEERETDEIMKLVTKVMNEDSYSN